MNKTKKAGGAPSAWNKTETLIESLWKKLTARIPENVLTTILLLGVGVILLCVFYLPQKIEDYQCSQFAKPLFGHLLPKNSYAVQTSSVRDDNGGTTATIILGTADDLSEASLYTFYADGEYMPAREGERVKLSVKELDSGSISALKQAGMYRDGDEYYFIYIYSAKEK